MKRAFSLLASFMAVTGLSVVAAAQTKEKKCVEAVNQSVVPKAVPSFGLTSYYYKNKFMSPLNVWVFSMSPEQLDPVYLEVYDGNRSNDGNLRVIASFSPLKECHAVACFPSITSNKQYHVKDGAHEYDISGQLVRAPDTYWSVSPNLAGLYRVDITQGVELNGSQTCEGTPTKIVTPNVDENVSVQLTGKPRRVLLDAPEIIHVPKGAQEARDISISRSRDVHFTQGSSIGGTLGGSGTLEIKPFTIGLTASLNKEFNKAYGVNMGETITKGRSVILSGDSCSDWELSSYALMQSGLVSAPSLGVNEPIAFEFTKDLDIQYRCVAKNATSIPADKPSTYKKSSNIETPHFPEHQ